MAFRNWLHTLVLVDSNHLMYDEADGAGGGAGAGAVVPGAGSGTPPGAAGTQVADPTGTPRTGATSGFTYQEDRSNWIPQHRFNETSQKMREVQAQLQERERQIAALTGVQSPDLKSAKSAEVKAALLEMLPELKTLPEVERLTAAQKASEARHWKQHSDNQITQISGRIAEALGTDALTPKQEKGIRDQFGAYMKDRVQAELQASGGTASATLTAYENGNTKGLLDDFVKEFSSMYIEPARRVATNTNVSRARQAVPNSAGRSPVTSVAKPEKFKSLDERLAYASGVLKEQGAFRS